MVREVYQEMVVLFLIFEFLKFILVDKLFAKALQRFATCLLVSNNVCEKSTSSLELPVIFDNNRSVVPVSFLLLILIN